MIASLNKHVLYTVVDFISPEKKVLPKWAKKLIIKNLRRIKRGVTNPTTSRVALAVIREIGDVWRFGNEVVLDFLYGTIKRLFGEEFLLDYVLDRFGLCLNPESITLIKRNILPEFPDLINWGALSANPSAIDILEANQDRIVWRNLSANFSAGKLIKARFLEKGADWGVDWRLLSKNSSSEALDLLEHNTDKIDWLLLAENKNPRAVGILEKNPAQIDWKILSFNPSAIGFLEKNIEKVFWYGISRNPGGVPLLMKNPEKIDWDNLSANSSAGELLADNLDKVNWTIANSNPSVFYILKHYSAGGIHSDRVSWKHLIKNPKLYHVNRYIRLAEKEEFVRALLL